ncbi:MAG: hypothetical protein ACI90V_009371, partial [Bacillariaceae sp.]
TYEYYNHGCVYKSSSDEGLSYIYLTDGISCTINRLNIILWGLV